MIVERSPDQLGLDLLVFRGFPQILEFPWILAQVVQLSLAVIVIDRQFVPRVAVHGSERARTASEVLV